MWRVACLVKKEHGNVRLYLFAQSVWAKACQALPQTLYAGMCECTSNRLLPSLVSRAGVLFWRSAAKIYWPSLSFSFLFQVRVPRLHGANHRPSLEYYPGLRPNLGHGRWEGCWAGHTRQVASGTAIFYWKLWVRVRVPVAANNVDFRQITNIFSMCRAASSVPWTWVLGEFWDYLLQCWVS